MLSLLLKTGDQFCLLFQSEIVRTHGADCSLDWCWLQMLLKWPSCPSLIVLLLFFSPGEKGRGIRGTAQCRKTGSFSSFLSHAIFHRCIFSPLNVFNSWVSKVQKSESEIRKHFWKANCMRRNAEVFPCFHLCNVVFQSVAKCFDISSGLENLWGWYWADERIRTTSWMSGNFVRVHSFLCNIQKCQADLSGLSLCSFVRQRKHKSWTLSWVKCHWDNLRSACEVSISLRSWRFASVCLSLCPFLGLVKVILDLLE